MGCRRNNKGKIVGGILAVAGIAIILAVVLPTSWWWFIVGVVLLVLGIFALKN